MLRKYTRYDMDGRSKTVWINDDHIVALSDESTPGVHRTGIIGVVGFWSAEGTADDLASIIRDGVES